MELRTCNKCKKLFYYLSGDCLCQDCQKYMNELLQKTSQYVSEHTDVRMTQVSTDSDVAMPQIVKWVKNEQLHTVDEQDVYSVCEGCGKPIPSGHFCNLCKQKLLGGVKNAMEADKPHHAVKEPPKSKSSKMRFLKHD